MLLSNMQRIAKMQSN